MPVSSIPDSAPGFYGSYTTEEHGAYEDTYYILHTDSSIGSDDIAVYASQELVRVTGVSLLTATKIDAVIDGRKFYLPDITAGDLFALTDAKSFHVYWMGLGIYVDDITFFFAFEDLTPGCRAKVEKDEYVELELMAEDFNPSAKPDFVLLGSRNFN